MGFNRRQFLLLGGAFGGVGLALAAQRLLAINRASQDSIPLQKLQNVTSTPIAQSSPTSGIFNPPRGDARIVVISDLNSQYGSTDYEPEVDQAIALLSTWKPDLVLCGGDMVAGQSPSLSISELEAMWAGFDQHVSAPMRQAKIPYGFTLGNHDASGAIATDGGFLFNKDRDAASAYWNDPSHNPGIQFVDRTGFPFHYTFQQNDIFFLVWDASAAKIPAAQIAWAEKSLASSTAQSAKLRIAIGHLPLYAITVGRDEPGEYLEKAEELRSLLERYKVHTYISGHDHAYYPGHQGNLELLHCGILGSGTRPLLNGDLRPQKTLTVVDVSLSQADTTYTTYDMATLELINQQQLPKLIATPTAKVLRRDVEWASLTPAEQALEYTPSY
ncbi:MAG: metallophosphoesterase [Timaviella obliquedivisa GSE-PSE-MK23-08B]|nr:metallophosphoesterase [Timaviella obliquedivisa GSE-PSE-MK23-08B]